MQVDLGRAERLRQLEQRREIPVIDPADNRRDRQLDPGARQVAGGGDGRGEAAVIAADPMAENSLAKPDAVKPVTERVELKAGVIERTLPAYSVTVLRPAP